MISVLLDLLKVIGSALVAASATIYGLHIKRKWEKQDKQDKSKDTMEEKIDKMMTELGNLSTKVEKLSNELDAEISSINSNIESLQAGLRETLYERIKFLCKKYVNEGMLREEEYNSLNRMWKVYHEELKGNGFLDGEMEAIEKLEKY